MPNTTNFFLETPLDLLHSAVKERDQAIKERDAWIETAKQAYRNTDYYCGLIVEVGKMFGNEAYISDDGSIREEVLCAKVPELVAKLVSNKI